MNECIVMYCIVLYCIVLYCIVLYSSIYIALLNSHRQTGTLLVRLAPRKVLRRDKDAGMLILVLVDSLSTYFKSLSWSLGVRSLSLFLWVRSLSLSWSLWSNPCPCF